MKKITMLSLLGVAMPLFAAMNDALLSFSTKGPDLYADGSVVVDGESYALVWTEDGNFEGLNANGEVVDANDKLLLVAPFAKDGRCPPVLFQISAATAEKLEGGVYGVYLLDTRIKDGVTGKVTVSQGVAETGKPSLVNGYGEVAKADTVGTVTDASSAKVDEDKEVVASTGAAIPANVQQPKIKAIQIVGDNVQLTVENLPGFMRIQSGTKVTDINVSGAAQATDGSAKDVILVMPKTGNSGFFKVIRN